LLHKEKYPILERDDNRHAIIRPDMVNKAYPMLPTDKLVISFFRDAIQTLLDEGKIALHTVIKGENDIVLYKYVDDDVMLMHGTVGCPATAGYMDELTGLGISKVMFCGGGGVLDRNIAVGELLVVEGAIRDEGFSYHYIAPSRIIYAQKDVQETICAYLREREIPHLRGITWTTDAIFRETEEMVAYRKEEGAKIVEMEQAGCIAVAEYRDIQYGAILYGGDDVSGTVWDKRGWHDRKGVRYALTEMCRDLVKEI